MVVVFLYHHFPCKDMKTHILITITLLAMLCGGCKALEGIGSKIFMPKNPELERVEQQHMTARHAIDAMKDPSIDEGKAQVIADTANYAGKHSKPTFFSAIVSALYTTEGRVIAVELVGLIATGAVLGWRLLVNRSALASTIRGIQQIRKSPTPHDGESAKVVLASEHAKSGMGGFMKRRVAKVLGEHKLVNV